MTMKIKNVQIGNENFYMGHKYYRLDFELEGDDHEYSLVIRKIGHMRFIPYHFTKQGTDFYWHRSDGKPNEILLEMMNMAVKHNNVRIKLLLH